MAVETRSGVDRPGNETEAMKNGIMPDELQTAAGGDIANYLFRACRPAA